MLNTEIRNLEKEVAENQAALDKAREAKLVCLHVAILKLRPFAMSRSAQTNFNRTRISACLPMALRGPHGVYTGAPLNHIPRMLHLALKAFYPNVPPFPLLHVDTGWKFQMMYEFRDKVVKKTGMQLLVHKNQDGVEMNINPFDSGSQKHTEIMKTVALKQALDKMKFDVAFGGARRDEEKSRAKERIFSFRDSNHRWDPKNQRPELWNIFNGRKKIGEHFRVFPISNWTEMDVWQYILNEKIELPSLYFSHKREVVKRNGVLLGKCNYISLKEGEKWEVMTIRCRTIGDMTCTGVAKSKAGSVAEIIEEVASTRITERGGTADR